MAQHLEIGQWGEEIACQYLEKKGYTILDRNFRRKWGEIDIVCRAPMNVPRGTPFVTQPQSVEDDSSETKTASPRNNLLRYIGSSHERGGTIVFVEVKTLQSYSLRPEDNITPSKQRKLIRSCQLYLSQKKYPNNIDWQIDVIAVLLDKRTGKANVEHLEQAVYFS